MTGEAFEYAIKKDVRNNPIVREIDRERHREMWRSASVGAFVVAMLVFFVWHRINLLHEEVQFQDVQEELAAQQKINDQLRVSIASLHALAAIETRARQFGMVLPDLAQTEIIDRVITSQPPASSVLARR